MSRYAAVYRARDSAACDERRLVLEAVNVRHWVVRDADQYVILVRERDARWAQDQLARYDAENRVSGVAPAAPAPRYSEGFSAALCYVLILCVVHALKNTYLTSANWALVGRIDAQAIRAGEWWRCVTALTLHVDVAHLASNIVFGALFGVFLAHALGAGAAWLLTLLAGALGNLANAFLLREHHAMGASTGVFGAVGALAVLEFLRRFRAPHASVRFAPVIVGAVLLGLLGGGARTDVLAHCTGMAAGAFFALVACAIARPFPTARWPHALLGVIAIAILATCWLLALRG
ncbi:MAG: rhomboid family intramembrane serine protease [Planctomycetota bacterium]